MFKKTIFWTKINLEYIYLLKEQRLRESLYQAYVGTGGSCFPSNDKLLKRSN